MKYILVIFMLCCIGPVIAQNWNANKKYVLKTTKRSESGKLDTHSDGSGVYKIKTPRVSKKVLFTLTFRRYINGNEVNADNSYVYSCYLEKGESRTFEIAVDTTFKDFAKLFFYFPGSTWYCYAYKEPEERLNYKLFREFPEKINTMIPLLLVYKDEEGENHYFEDKKNLTGDSISVKNFKREELNRSFRRYYLVSYVLEPVKQH